jgi:DNA-directed RNA polymerase subunit E'
MYKVLTIEDKIRVPPKKFHLNVNGAVIDSLEDRWEGITDRRMGVVLSVIGVDHIGEGKLLPGDGAIHYPVKFQLLAYSPDNHEIIKGNAIDVTEFGVFIRMGPVDGMIHVSQIMDDYVTYDSKNSVFHGRDSNRLIKEGDTVVARVVSVSMDASQYKIGLTTRQPGLGVVAWIEKEKKSGGKIAKKPAKEVRGKKGGRRGPPKRGGKGKK